MALTPEEIQVVYSWLPPEALDLFLEHWPESGDATVAWAYVRKDDRYDTWFPGNMTEDGRPRYDESVYAAVTASYDDVFRAAGLEGDALDLMRSRYGDLIEGDVAPTELETNRVKPTYERVIMASDAIKDEYFRRFAQGFSDLDLLVSAMDPNLGELVLTNQISLAEIGGEYRESSYALSDEQIDRLAGVAGFGREEANIAAQEAETMVPLMSVLARRHNDPDDEFDINDFNASEIFKDPQEMYRMRRLMAQERSMFGKRGNIARNRAGALTGLIES